MKLVSLETMYSNIFNHTVLKLAWKKNIDTYILCFTDIKIEVCGIASTGNDISLKYITLIFFPK